MSKIKATWSPDVDAYAAGGLPPHKIRCALCRQAPCGCLPFGSPEYLALFARRHR